jgi:adenylosuccinate synthase
MKAVAIVDLQFGSTGKGLLAAYLGLYGHGGEKFDAVATNWGPNAGHTAVYDDGEKVVRTMLANSVHRGSISKVFIGPGSVINIENLMAEVKQTADTGKPFVVYVHEHAAVVHDEDRVAEKVHNRIGSTQKGAGQALINKINRDSTLPCLAKHWAPVMNSLLGPHLDVEIKVIGHREYLKKLNECRMVLLEGCQGYSLGYSSGIWPYVTSRECTTAQLLTDTLVSPAQLVDTYGVFRSYPIRVANRFNEAGEMVGFSGPGYPGQKETTFEAIGQPTEYTTVTKLPRRVFEFSAEQVADAIVANGVTRLFFNFVNYYPEDRRSEEILYRATSVDAALYDEFNHQPLFHHHWLIGDGPKVNNIRNLNQYAGATA